MFCIYAPGAFKARVRCPKFVPWVASCLGGRLWHRAGNAGFCLVAKIEITYRQMCCFDSLFLPQNGTPNTESGAISLFDCILMHIAHDRLLLPPIMPIPK